MRLDIRGALRNPDALRSFTRDDGTEASEEESRAFLLTKFAQGHDFLPMGDCEGFDPKTGCPGHEKAETP